MSASPPSPVSLSRRILIAIIWIGWAALVLVTALGFTAAWIPAFDLVNAARPALALIAVALLLIAIPLRQGSLIRPTAGLALLQVGLLLLPWARAAASTSGPASLRLVTFDLGAGNERFDDIAEFILGAGADVVLLQEVSCGAADRLIPKLRPSYANVYVSAEGCAGQAVLAKRPWSALGQVITATAKPLVVSARLQWGNTGFVLSSVRLADPFAPVAQASDIERLRAHLATQGPMQIVAGAFNIPPFAWKFAQLQGSGFGQHATFLATWPGQWSTPLVLLDNVFSTEGIASVHVAVGPPLGSDHRPLIADIALGK